MTKKSTTWIAIILGIFLIICLILGALQIKFKNKSYAGLLFENSSWLLTWEDLYEVCESATRFEANSEMAQVNILYQNKADFNSDVEDMLQYVIETCGKPYYNTGGENPEDYISKSHNTGSYEEELSWISMPGSCLGVRLVRLGSGEDAYMKVIIEKESLQFLDGEVVKSDNTELIVKIGDEQVRLAWHYVTGKRNLSETTPLYQLGDKVRIGIPEEQEVKYYDGNEYGTLGIKYLEKTTDSLTQSEIDRHDKYRKRHDVLRNGR